MGSGAQAQIAASQAASAEQRQSFEEALAFQKDIYNQQKQARMPYINAGTSSLQMLMNLLGLTPTISGNNPLPTVSGNAGGSTTRNSFTGGGGGGGTNTGTRTGTGAGFAPLPTQNTQFPHDPATDPSSLVSGGQQFSAPLQDNGTQAVPITDQQGNQQWVPASLVPFYQSKGWSA